MRISPYARHPSWRMEVPGVVVSDWGGSNDRVKGLIAGNELEMPTTGGETNDEIVAAVKNGTIPESLLDENLDRLLTLIFDTSKLSRKARSLLITKPITC